MNITVFTSNQPRHLSLIQDLAKIADNVYAILEVNTVFPGQTEDFYKKTEVMKNYFSRVIESERKIFGNIDFLPSNVRPLAIKLSDLNKLSMEVLKPALNSDYYIVFGASYIKGDLIDFLVSKNAYNIHMGVSPYYRGNSCNFWASYDKNFQYVGATIHMLSKGLDSGNILFHALPSFEANPFDLGMKAVRSAHKNLIENIKTGKIHQFKKVKQNRDQELKYTKNIQFNDEIALEYLNSLPNESEIRISLEQLNLDEFINPQIF